MTTQVVDSDEIRAARKVAAALHERVSMLSEDALDLLFLEARSHNGWLDRDVPKNVIRSLYALARMGPTCANSNPARFIFLTSSNSKEQLRSFVAAGNVNKVVTAPVVVIIGHDLDFHRHLNRLFAHSPGMQKKYAADRSLANTTALRNGTLQGAWLMIAARAMGLDCGPMSGFDNEKVDEEYFRDSDIKSNFICALGYGDTDKLFQRLPRFDFDEVCEIR